ncbi:hypothetical protein FRC09_016896 [Ceratobasidium sp. 395]|nr:hypothetical protein FRC09_016896 [Ceratobasidium sp. 395]
MKVLSKLGLGVDVLSQQVLAAVGYMPALNSFTLRFHPFAQPNLKKLQAASSSFQQLDYLAVYAASSEDLFYLVQLRPLISGVQTIILEISHCLQMDYHLERAAWTLCEHAHLLDVLSICYPDYGPESHEIQSQNLLSTISRLALKKLAIFNAHIPWDDSFEDVITTSRKWRGSMTQFVMPCQTVTHFGLRMFARFSALEVLFVNLMEEDVPPAVGLISAPRSNRTVRLESHFLLSDMLPTDVVALAQWVALLFLMIVMLTLSTE